MPGGLETAGETVETVVVGAQEAWDKIKSAGGSILERLGTAPGTRPTN